MIAATAKERQIWFWQKECEARLYAWKECRRIGDDEGSRQAESQYISARITLEELKGRKE